MSKYGPVVLQVGQRFGRWTVLENTRPVPVVCECGKKKTVWIADLLRGRTKSCGCLKDEKTVVRLRTHGGSYTPEYGAWKLAKGRCFNIKYIGWKNYGGRGITMCPEWAASFGLFLQHIGPRPSSKHSLDRIENNRGYEPGNVRWATDKEQMNNRRPSTEWSRRQTT